MASHAELTSYINSLAPTAYWTMAESGGTFAQTGSSTAAALAPTGTVVYNDTELIAGDATRFARFTPGSYANGSRGNVTVPATTLSASAIVYYTPPVITNNLRVLSLAASGETAITNYQLLMQIRLDALLGDFHEYDTGVNQDAITTLGIDPRYVVGSGTPMLFTLTRDGATKRTRFYVNGIALDEVSYTNAPTSGSSTVFVLGHHPTLSGNTSSQDISYGHVSYFQRVLSDQEVRDMAAAAGLLDAPAGEVRFDAQADVVNNTNATVVKTLMCAIDPLIDISVAFPDEAYTYEE